jgi:predicted RNA methylase
VQFYKLVSKLIELDFQVAIAIPSVANEFSLTVKINSKSQIYKNEEEISFVLNILKICFEEASKSEIVFWQAYCELSDKNIELNKDSVKDLNSVIELLKTDYIIIKENPIEMQTLLKKKDDKWRFFLPLDGPDTVIEAIRTMILLKESNNNTFDVEWVVGFLGVNQYNSAPLLFLIKNAEIHLVITDFVDTLILMDGVKQ